MPFDLNSESTIQRIEVIGIAMELVLYVMSIVALSMLLWNWKAYAGFRDPYNQALRYQTMLSQHTPGTNAANAWPGIET